eukprot:6198203-Pleurochrysis_carterae.AAC.2
MQCFQHILLLTQSRIALGSKGGSTRSAKHWKDVLDYTIPPRFSTQQSRVKHLESPRLHVAKSINVAIKKSQFALASQ